MIFIKIFISKYVVTGTVSYSRSIPSAKDLQIWDKALQRVQIL